MHYKRLALAIAIATSTTSHSLLADDHADIETVRVLAQRVVVRNHVNNTAPKLVYDTAYFQRFEPISVGDMLKRVPGVTFNSDVGEYDLPRLRGLDSRYTQVLINGQPIPGSENDGSIAVDRIPAEIVEKIEIIRSPSSDIRSEGIGGSLNIILKQGARYEGGTWRLGVIDMEKARGSGFVSFSGTNGRIEYGISANVQERYNPKEKTSSAIEEDEQETVVESDVRDSRDVALDGDIGVNLDNGDSLKLRWGYLDTEREEEENAIVSAFERADSDSPFVLDEVVREHQLEDIEQRNSNLEGSYELMGNDSETTLYTGLRNFTEDKTETNSEADFGDQLELDEVEETAIDDTEWRAGFRSTYTLSNFETRYGAEYYNKERDFSVEVFNDEGELDDENDEYADFEAEISGVDLYAVGQWQLTDDKEVELGLRAEYTDLTIRGGDFDGTITRHEDDDWEINPTLHFRWHISETDQFRASIARTLRRPEFDQLNPVELTIEDEKFRGNAELEPEKSWGLDVGYDHFMSDKGVIGLNLFYRRVTDLIEFTQSEISTVDGNFDLREPINNQDNGIIYGAELDVSAPAAWLNLDDLQWFVNLTLLDSEVDDPYFEGLERRFSGQADYVYNIGFEHELRQWSMSYGLSYQKQDEAEEFEGGEVNRVSYDGNLEAFIEKRFANGDYVLRLAAQNLLNAEKKELIREYEDIDAYRSGSPESSEVEREETEPAIILTLRGRF